MAKAICISSLVLLFLTVDIQAENPPTCTPKATYDSGEYDYYPCFTVDGNNDLLLFGKSQKGADEQLKLVKYGAAGTKTWEVIITSSTRGVFAGQVITDPSGNVLAAGAVYNYDSRHNLVYIPVIAKYGASGAQLWISSANTTSSYHEFCNGLCLDKDGNILVAGTSGFELYSAWWAPGATTIKGFIKKFSPDGSLLWSKTYGESARGGFNKITVDGNGDIIVAGLSKSDDKGYSLVEKIDPSGNEVWRYVRSGAESTLDDLKVNSQGEIFAAGCHDTGSSSDRGLLVLKLDSAGKLVWDMASYGTAGDQAYGYNIELDDSGCLYVAGTKMKSSANVSLFVKYDGNGKLLWDLGPEIKGLYEISRCVIGSGGKIAAVGALLNSDYDAVIYSFDQKPQYTPSNLVWSADTGVLEWSYSRSNEEGFCVEQSMDNVHWQTVARIPRLSTHYVLPLSTDRSYYFRLCAYNGGLKSPYTNVVSLVPGLKQQLILFPNPVYPAQSPFMTIKGLEENSNILIYNIAGELVREMSHDTTGLAYWDGKNNAGEPVSSGIYIVLEKSPRCVKKAKAAVVR